MTLSGVGANGHLFKPMPVAVKVSLDGPGLPPHADADITSLRRMRWLDSTLGSDRTVPKPFTPMTVTKIEAGQYVVQALNKQVVLDPNSGLPLQALTMANKTQRGQNRLSTYPLLKEAMHFELVAANTNASIPLVAVGSVQVDSSHDDAVTWTCVSQGPYPGMDGVSVRLSVTGELDFTGYGTLNMTAEAVGGPVRLNDIRLRAVTNLTHTRYMLGLGQGAAPTGNIQWLWNAAQAHNGVWLGRIEGGLYLMPRGEGTAWDNPLYSKDTPIIPFIPPSWGGIKATMPNVTSTLTGVGVDAAGQVTAWSGPRTLTPGAPLEYLLNFAVTPSKPIDWPAHWRQRIFQVGYGTEYFTPQQVKDGGATVVTLHQGTSGIINGSLVNPYINYPCTLSGAQCVHLPDPASPYCQPKLDFCGSLCGSIFLRKPLSSQTHCPTHLPSTHSRR